MCFFFLENFCTLEKIFLSVLMAAPKYKRYFEQMFEENRELFMQFMLLNQAYGQDKQSVRPKFNAEGEKIKAIVHDWENRLCGQMENGQNGSYSAKLGEKFQSEVTKYFPYFHDIGLS